MKNLYIKITFLLIVITTNAQNNKLWTGYFSYNSIKDISIDNNYIYAATENAYFKKNISTNEATTYTTIEGLSGETISQIYHSANFNKTLIGYQNGLLIVTNDSDGSMLNIVDILNKPSIPSNKKTINHFMEYNGKVYISTNFGISVFDLNTLEFGDTFFIGANGSNTDVNQTAVFNNEIYAATTSGLLKANINNTNLIDFNQWISVNGNSWANVENLGSRLVAQDNGGNFWSLTSSTALQLSFSIPEICKDARFVNGKYIITLSNSIQIYDDQLQLLNTINGSSLNLTNFTCATLINNKIYIGTQKNGVQVANLTNPITSENISPKGTINNKVFRVKAFSKGFWAVYGDYNKDYDPYPLDNYNVTKFHVDNGWKEITYSQLFNAKSISGILINPKNENEVYLSSFYSGLVKIVNDIPSQIYNSTNSSLVTIPGQVPDDLRVSQAAYDKNGDIWMATSQTNKPLHQFKANGLWTSYNLSCSPTQTINSHNSVIVDKNGTKWITSNFSGIIGINESKNKCSIITLNQGNGNLPSVDARVAAIDNKNKLWIGTTKGIRVLQNVDSFLTQNQLNTNSIIILENNTAEELLFNQSITDIVVDGANNKWVATAGAGVFQFSSDGQKTLHVFTKENSPLPNNTVMDIDINETTGEVFFATDGGLVSYNGTATKGRENFDNVIVYPNPVRPQFEGNVVITGLMDKANVKITDIEGNLVHESISEGGTVEWNTTVFGKNKVASGVYLIFLASESGEDTLVQKVMIVR